MEDTVKLKEKDIKAYLENCIKHWRSRKTEAELRNDANFLLMCACYIDAFQSVRISLFGDYDFL